MKLSPRTKRILTIMSVMILAVVLTGCTSPVDEKNIMKKSQTLLMSIQIISCHKRLISLSILEKNLVTREQKMLKDLLMG